MLVVLADSSESSQRLAKIVSFIASAAPHLSYGIRLLVPSEIGTLVVPKITLFRNGVAEEYSGVFTQQAILNYALSVSV